MSEPDQRPLRIESLAIGDELLDGRVTDTNTRNLGDQLSILGLELQGSRVVPDDRALIMAALREACARADIVVTSGGLGPTTDDITGECIAEVAKTGLRLDDEALGHMVGLFAARGIPMADNNRRQALLPATSRTLLNVLGTAPGFVTPLAQPEGRVAEVWSFPGVPHEYNHLRDTQLLPALRARVEGQKPKVLLRRTLRSLGLAESTIGERLTSLAKENPDVRVQYRAAHPEIIVRLVLAVDAVHADAQGIRLDLLAEEARGLIGKSVYGVGDDALEARVLQCLQQQSLTMGTAESCTGGLVVKRLTDVAGSSAVVKGAVVSYANSVKQGVLGVSSSILESDGAVSEACARAMAEGAKKALDVDVTVAITGVAGPGGGSDDKPVGTVWFAVHHRGKTTTTLKKFPDFGRERIRDMAAATALRLVLDTIFVSGATKTIWS